MRKNKKGKNKKHNSPKNASLIKDIDINNIVAIDLILKDDYPIFCFKYLSDVSIKDCSDHSFFSVT